MRKIFLVLITLWLIIPAIHAQKVGLVLSGGGAKGMTHIGIIRALEENNIPIDYIAGTSMGAIIGSLYAMGYSPDDMVELLKSEDFKRWYSGEVEENMYITSKRIFPLPNSSIFVFIQRLTEKFETSIPAYQCCQSDSDESRFRRPICTCHSCL